MRLSNSLSVIEVAIGMIKNLNADKHSLWGKKHAFYQSSSLLKVVTATTTSCAQLSIGSQRMRHDLGD